MKKILTLAALALALTACSAGTQSARAPAPGVKVGKPYSVDGQTYYPEYDPHYDRTGVASWYGPGFHGGKTANGEVFNQHELTAAHPTLPMPSLVRVTNLENGKSAVVRVNDRGPFKSNRLIDLSRASAQTLGISGLGKVRVQYLREETEEYWAKMDLQTRDIAFSAKDPYAPTEEEREKSPGPPQEGDMKIARDETSPQIRSAAPLTSIDSQDLLPEKVQARPAASRFKLVNEAQAEEAPEASPPPPREEAEHKDARGSPPPKVVHLLDKTGKPVAVPPPGSAKVIYLTNKEHIDTSSEARESTGEVTEEKPMPLPHVSPPSSAMAAGEWYVQAGAYSSQANAQRLVDVLGASARADIRPVQANGQTLQRVRLGPFPSQARAQAMLEKAVAAGASGARIVKQ